MINEYTDRRTGATTRQMLAAPYGSVYIWVNSKFSYPKHLAHDLGRADLRIVGPAWLDSGAYLGIWLQGLVLDHAANLSIRQWNAYFEAKIRTEQLYHAISNR